MATIIFIPSLFHHLFFFFLSIGAELLLYHHLSITLQPAVWVCLVVNYISSHQYLNFFLN